MLGRLLGCFLSKKIMSEHLLGHMSSFVAVREEDQAGILAFFRQKNLKKRDNHLEEGQICKYHYFIVKGCLRLFFINEKGVEQTTYFASESWWLTDYLAFQSQQTTPFYIQAVENTQVSAIDWHSQERLLAQYPYLERYFRLVYQRACGAAQLRIKYLYEFSPGRALLPFQHALSRVCATHSPVSDGLLSEIYPRIPERNQKEKTILNQFNFCKRTSVHLCCNQTKSHNG
jgi:CRP-like cAMP-binding protein